MLGIAYTNVYQMPFFFSTGERSLTRDLLSLVARDGTRDGIVLARDAVGGALGVVASLGGLLLSLALRVLLLARRFPVVPAGGVTDGLDHVAFHGVVLAGGLAASVEARHVSSKGDKI